jgi:hypothetical protein
MVKWLAANAIQSAKAEIAGGRLICRPEPVQLLYSRKSFLNFLVVSLLNDETGQVVDLSKGAFTM